jgi:hypothetical protein
MGCGANSKITVKGGTITDTPQTTMLQAAGVTATAISPATISNGAVQFPISGGSFNNVSYAGTINTKGGLRFSGPRGRSVSLTKLSLNTQNGVLSAQANGQPVQLLQIAGSPTGYSSLVRETLSTISNSSNRINYAPLPSTVIAGGVALNQGLGIDVFRPGAQLGTISSTVTYTC